MSRAYFIHPLSFALFPIFSLFAGNINETFIFETFAPLGVMMLLGAALLFIFSFLFKSTEKGAIFTSAILLSMFAYGHFCVILYTIFPPLGSIFCWYGGFHVFWIFCLLAFAFFLGRTKKNLSLFTGFANVLGLALVGSTLWLVFSFQLTQGFYPFPSFDLYAAQASQFVSREDIRVVQEEQSIKPDIYYLVFDRYGRADTLQEVYHFNNTEFLASLERRGFYVARNSTANYPQSAHSLASSLNFQYLDSLAEKMGENSYDWKPLYTLLQDNRVQDFLEKQGYTYIHSGSWWQPTSGNRNADIHISLYPLSEFSSTLFRNTAFYPIAWYMRIYDRDYWQWERVLYKFEQLAKVPNMRESTFVFAHFNVPHPPFVFHEDGSYRQGGSVIDERSKEYYADQVAFTNKKIEELVDALIANSPTPPVIILQGDEGPYPMRLASSPSRFDWASITDEEVRQKMGILNVYYFPGVDASEFYSSITPVNSFRFLFNTYFGANLELLPDNAYVFAKTELQLYDFLLVNDKVKQ